MTRLGRIFGSPTFVSKHERWHILILNRCRTHNHFRLAAKHKASCSVTHHRVSVCIPKLGASENDFYHRGAFVN